MSTDVKAGDRFRLLYLYVSIVLVGLVEGYLFGCHLMFLIGRFSRPVWRLAGRYFAWGIRRLLQLQPGLKIDCRVEIPKGGEKCLLIANHRSHLDVFLMIGHVPNIRIVAKRALFRIPFLRLWLRAQKHIRLDASPEGYWRAMCGAEMALGEGDPVLIFPEMTRCDPGLLGVGSFHLAPFHVAMRTLAPVIPVAITGTDEVWPKGRCGINYKSPVRVESLPPIDPRNFASAELLRQQVQSRIHEQVQLRMLSC